MTSITSTAWQKMRRGLLEAARQAGTPCWICRKPINYELTGRSPMAPTLDHLVPRFMGGDVLDPANLAPAHFACNSRRGAVQRNAAGPRPSRRW